MALLTRNFCPKYAFTHTVTYANKRTIAASAYGIKVPAGFKGALPAPDIINTLAMQSKTKHGANKGALTILSGLVVSSVKLRFPDPDKQWKNVNAGSKDSRWQFQGGNVCFELNLEVYVLDTYRPIPNDTWASWTVLMRLLRLKRQNESKIGLKHSRRKWSD